jgi:hypothetical protein
MKKNSDCPKESTCTSKPLFTVLQTNMLQSMNAYSLADMPMLHPDSVGTTPGRQEN